jgi:ACS family allantoate permease-like MFS transporter
MIPAGGLTVFFTLLIQGYGFDSRTSLLVTMPGGLLQIIVNLGFPYLAFKINNRMLSASIAMLLSLFGIALMTGLAREGPTAHRIGQLVGYYILYGNTATAFILILSSVSTNVAGYTKKTTVNAMTLISYCVGFLIGPQTFRDGPHYTNAKYNIIAQYFIALACCLALLWINARENKRRDAAAVDLPPQPVGQEFSDLTDKENKYFRYAM